MVPRAGEVVAINLLSPLFVLVSLATKSGKESLLLSRLKFRTDESLERYRSLVERENPLSMFLQNGDSSLSKTTRGQGVPEEDF